MSLGRGGDYPRAVSLALRDPHLHLRSHGKIGDCERSIFYQTS